MLIVCPTCATTYQIKLAALGEAGRTVRCAGCKETWFATPESAIAEMEPAQAQVPARMQAAAQSAAPAGAEPPVRDEFDAAAVSNFTVPIHTPLDDPAATGDAARALAVTESPPLAPQDQAQDGPARFDPGAPEDIETIAARRARHTYADRKGRRTLLQRVFSLPVLIALLAAIVLGALQGRVALVRQLPQTALLFAAIGMPVNLRGLSFMDVKSRSEFVDGATVLVVEGTIVNLTTKTLDIPRLRFSLRNGSGHEVYAWTVVASKSSLESGNGLAFRTRLGSPPPDGRDVIVRFFSRRDAGLGS
jgi:predicted Zn finger-like uncharacterized protein